MVVRNLLIVFVFLSVFGAVPGLPGASDEAIAADRRCLSKEQQRSAVSAGKAVPLASAMRSSKRRTPGEIVKAQLCEEPNGSLVYLLTVLARNGKVTRSVIDAANGAVATEH